MPFTGSTRCGALDQSDARPPEKPPTRFTSNHERMSCERMCQEYGATSTHQRDGTDNELRVCPKFYETSFCERANTNPGTVLEYTADGSGLGPTSLAITCTIICRRLAPPRPVRLCLSLFPCASEDARAELSRELWASEDTPCVEQLSFSQRRAPANLRSRKWRSAHWPTTRKRDLSRALYDIDTQTGPATTRRE